MPISLILGAISLWVAAAGAQSTYSIAAWPAVAGAEVGPDSTGALALGGVSSSTNLALFQTAVDQAGETAKVTDGNTTRNSVWNSVDLTAYNYYVQVDLSELRVVNRVVVRPVDGADGGTEYVKGYSVQTSEDDIVFRERASDLKNKNKLVDVAFSPVVARYVRVQVKAVDNVHRVQISEIEVYGEGHLSSGTFTSGVTDLGAARAKNIGRVTWRAERPKGTELSLAFRSGPTSTPDDRWSDWWVPASADTSALPVLPEPRRYLQYRVTMATLNPSVTPRLISMQVEYGEFLAQTATATVARDDAGMALADTLPANQVPVGVAHDFLVTVQVTTGTGAGFDRLRLLLPNRGQVRKVWQGGIELVAGTDYTVASDTTSLEIRLATRVSTSTQFQVWFTTALFDDANLFRGQLVSDDQSDNPQELDATATGALTVYTTGLIARVLDWGRVEVTPNPFTPNGDGRSDTALITYELAKLGVARRVVLGLFDLSGRPVRRFEMSQRSGQHVVEWDGRDDGGSRVSPGLYLFSLDVDSDKPVKLCGTIAVAY